MRFVELDR